MSSDPYADLATSLGKFANSFRDLLDHAPDGVPGSAAAADYERYAGDWGEHPGRDVVASVLLTSWSCADHLAAAAVVMPERRCISSLYSLMRGAAEAAAAACCLAADDIDPLERVRRNMNLNLAALYEDARMIGQFASPASQQRAERHNTRIEAIVRTGELSGFRYTKPNPYRAGWIGEQPPAAMALIDQCASAKAGVGVTYHRLLSSVSHGQLHGLSRFLMQLPAPAADGQVQVQINVAAQVLALHLLAGPLCASTLVERLRWFFGWDTSEIEPAARMMLATWGRIGEVEYPGPWSARPTR